MAEGPGSRRDNPGSSREQDAPGASGLVPQLLWESKIGKRQPKTTNVKGTGGERHFLVPPFGQWLAIEPTTTPIVLGRDKQCDVVINSPTVSRRHVQLEFKGSPRRLHLTDLGTVNGTTLNGKPLVGEHTLADRDVLRIGEVSAVYRLLPAGASATAREPEPSVERLNTTMPIGTPIEKSAVGGLAGDIALYPMSELLGRLTLLRASGTFVVEVDGVAGRAVFAQGEIKDASFAGRTGPEAIQSLSELRRGSFRFQP